jgi:hypothetical protein
MRHRIALVPVFICLLALAACGSATTANTSPTATPTAASQPTPTNTPASSLKVYTSPDNKYQVSYPTGWQAQVADGNPGKVSFTGPDNQTFEVSDNAGTPGTDLAQFVTSYCQAVQQTPSSGQVKGTPVLLDGQSWFKAQCSADAQPANVLIVEVVTYKGAIYQIDYGSSSANFQADDSAFYAPMEQSFKFLT